VLPFGKVSDALASLIGVASGREDRFQARLKQLQRMGFPPGVNVGRYAKARYDGSQLLQLAVALELLQVGLSPERATKTVLKWWDGIRRAVVAARDHPATLVATAFMPKDFGGLTSATTSEDDRIAWTGDGLITFRFSGKDDPDIASDLTHLLTAPRAVIINVSRIVAELDDALVKQGVGSGTIWSEVDGWRNEIDWSGRRIGSNHDSDPEA
jgi:hypothetical protein